MEDVEKFEIKVKAFIVFILFSFIAFISILFIGIIKVDAASYSSYIWEEPSYIQFKNSSSTSLTQCNNSDICAYTGGNDAVGFYINYSVSKIDTPPMVQKSYKVSIEFSLTSSNATSISTSSSAHSMQMQVRNSATGAYTTATCDGSESLTITKQDNATTRVKYNCSKLNVSSTVYVMALNYRYTPPTNYALPYWSLIIMEQNLAVVDLSDPNQSIIDSQIAAANSIITNNDKNTEKLLDEIEKNNQELIDAIEGEDLTTSEKTPVDKSELNDYESSEDALLNEDRLNSINDIDISIDSNTNDFIWDFITSAINTHTRIFGFVVTILSIGIIKLALNR